MNSLVKPLETFIFASRWIQAPLYVGLIIAQMIYCWLFMIELSHLVHGAITGSNFTETEVMLVVLGLIDVVMIANLLIMVIVGGYETFVSRLDLEDHPDQPEWLSHVNAGVLKIKLSTAIIGISSIHLLKSFINAANLTEHTLQWQVDHSRRLPFLGPGHGHCRQDHDPDPRPSTPETPLTRSRA